MEAGWGGEEHKSAREKLRVREEEIQEREEGHEAPFIVGQAYLAIAR